MRLKFPELSAKEIFSRGGFDIDILHDKLPQRRIKEWLDNYKKFGVSYFLPENKYYFTLNKQQKRVQEIDTFKLKLLKRILEDLEKLKNENR